MNIERRACHWPKTKEILRIGIIPRSAQQRQDYRSLLEGSKLHYRRFSRWNRKNFISWTPIAFDFKQFSEKYDNYRSIVFSRATDGLLTKIFVWLLNFEETRYLWARCIFHRNFIEKWDANINRTLSHTLPRTLTWRSVYPHLCESLYWNRKDHFSGSLGWEFCIVLQIILISWYRLGKLMPRVYPRVKAPLVTLWRSHGS